MNKQTLPIDSNERTLPIDSNERTLPIDSNERKGFPMFSGLLAYFTAALASVSRISKVGNDKHNPGQPLHHARGKSNDHADCIVRHLVDLADVEATIARDGSSPELVAQAIEEASCLAWRALALSQELHERLAGAPLASAARLPEPTKHVIPFDERRHPGCPSNECAIRQRCTGSAGCPNTNRKG